MQPALRLMPSEVARLHYGVQALATHGLWPELVDLVLEHLLAFCARGFDPALWLRPQCFDWLLENRDSGAKLRESTLTLYVGCFGIQYITLASFFVDDGGKATLFGLECRSCGSSSVVEIVAFHIGVANCVRARIVAGDYSGGLATNLQDRLASELLRTCNTVCEIVVPDEAPITAHTAYRRLHDALSRNELRAMDPLLSTFPSSSSSCCDHDIAVLRRELCTARHSHSLTFRQSDLAHALACALYYS